ncbi:hypothetical protein BDV25DRAFT_153363 [Aspergillus avenaceus]|uniref:AMP-activated protein kinase glycogen-binding domain-containing protein n=1 Tax=Aspergillus avenaceus TaxID=36643 RepID=A0A5N6TY49_ASPAV|nr:hypothetical protein BDV25DRAFT_153363 [Aspergillus avenaceus]
MGSYTFRWPHTADEVFVTGTFDDWGKTVKLDRKGDIFEKEISLPLTDEKLHYKFVVDGFWTTDHSVPEEDDGNHNINNVLYPDQIQKEPNTTTFQNGSTVMAGVTPDSTTAALAGGVPKQSGKEPVGDAIFSSTAPGSTTADLAKNAPLEQRANVPGTFPSTPGSEAEAFSVNPIPASSGTGNPIKLRPGEKVPDPSTFNSNTISSTARTDKAGYEQNASHPLAGDQSNEANAFAVPPVSKNMIPESSLPMGQASHGTSDPVTVQSAAPISTTAGLAGAVPLESQKNQARPNLDSTVPENDVPEVVRHSMSEAHVDPEAAAHKEALGEKKELEHELQQKVPVDESAGTPAPTAGITAATSETAPRATNPEPESAQLSPRATTPTTKPDTTEEAEPAVTTGPETTKASEISGPDSALAAPTAGDTGASATKTAEPANPTITSGATSEPKSPNKDTARKDSGSSNGSKKKRNRASGFFSKIKEKLTH